MNSKKLFFSITSVALTLSLSMTGISASAENIDSSIGISTTSSIENTKFSSKLVNNFNPGTYISSDEQYELFKEKCNPDTDRLLEYELMMEEHEAILNSGNNINSLLRASVRRLGVPFYNQQYGYYCGPATIRQVCGYLNGTSNLPSQDKIADDMNTTSSNGTDQGELIDYLNSHTSKTYESLWAGGAFTSSSQLFNLIIQDTNNNKPTVIHIEDTNLGNWRYCTDGHYLCTEGYIDDTTTNGHNVYLVDPWLNGHNISSGKYDVTVDRLYNVTDRIGA